MKQNKEELLSKLNKLSLKKQKIFDPKIIAPAKLPANKDLCLKGFYFEKTNIFNIVDFKSIGTSEEGWQFPFYANEGVKELGYFLSGSTLQKLEEKIDIPYSRLNQREAEKVLGFLKNENILNEKTSQRKFVLGAYVDDDQFFFSISGQEIKKCELENYSLKLDVFSRNTGILETDMMQGKAAVISGCGSVGSYIALELARSGVGRFLLVDNDILSYANVCRHQCNISDVGNYKTNALADRIRLINPAAEIECRNDIIENVVPEVFEKFCGEESIIVGCADNRQGDLFANKIAAHYNMPFVSVGFWERAFAGEIFYWIPDQKDLACYQCFTDALGELSARQSVNRRFYTTEEDLSKVSFMPGISVDINFVSNVGIKIILDILNRNNRKFLPRVLEGLTQFTLVANTNRKEIGGEQAEIFSYPLQVTTSIEVDKNPNCKFCSKS